MEPGAATDSGLKAMPLGTPRGVRLISWLRWRVQGGHWWDLPKQTKVAERERRRGEGGGNQRVKRRSEKVSEDELEKIDGLRKGDILDF